LKRATVDNEAEEYSPATYAKAKRWKEDLIGFLFVPPVVFLIFAFYWLGSWTLNGK
jgi:hypothetical protein